MENQLKWELLKYEIRRFTIWYCKQHTKKDVAEKKYLKKNYKALRILGIIKAIYKATTLLQTKSKKYMKNDRRHKNKKEMLVLQRRWKIIENVFTLGKTTDLKIYCKKPRNHALEQDSEWTDSFL